MHWPAGGPPSCAIIPSQLILKNREHRVTRIERRIALLTHELKTIVIEYRAAKDACAAALLRKRHAQAQWERELMRARKERPGANAPAWACEARDAAAAAWVEAVERRKALQVDVRKRKQAISGWESRRKRIRAGKHPLSWEKAYSGA
jgi:hypothetical protein